MKKTRFKGKTDQYGIVRGAISVVLLFALSIALFGYALLLYANFGEEERASEAAKRVAVQFDQLVDSSFQQMHTMAGLLDANAVSRESALNALLCESPFSDAGFMLDGDLTHADGSVDPLGNNPGYIHYDTSLEAGKLIAQADGRIQLRVPLAEKGELAAWIDPALLDEVLQSGFESGYDYAVYNEATGAYLINHTKFSAGGFYDALMGLNENGRMEAMINSDVSEVRIGSSKGNYYIAQQRSAYRPWNIALMLPTKLVHVDSPISRDMVIGAAIVAVLMLAMLLVWMVLSLRRARMISRSSRRAIDEGERLLNTVAIEARLTLLIYYRGQDKLMSCYDGLNLIGGAENGVRFSSLDTLIEACRLDEADAERMNQRLCELVPGEEAELIARCTPGGNKDEHMLRFVFSVPQEDAQTVFCCVRDYTRELLSQDRAEEERSYFSANQSKASYVWQINASRDRWCVLYAKNSDRLQKIGLELGTWRDYGVDFNGMLRDYFLKSDYEILADSISSSAIARMYRSGQREFVQDCRLRVPGSRTYEWRRIKMRISTNPDTENIIANLYIFDIDAEKSAEFERGERKRILGQTLTALGGVFYALYYVDLEKGLCYAAKSHGGDLVKELCAPYKDTFDRYVATRVYPDDQAQMLALLSPYGLRRTMTEGSHFRSRKYRRRVGDSYVWTEMIVQPARFENGTVREVVLALRSLGGETTEE